MKILQVTSKEELFEHLDGIEHDTEELYINTRPSVEIVNKIVESVPGIRRVYCPPSLLKQTSTKAFEVLDKHGVSLHHKEVKVGRPKKYSQNIVKEILAKRAEGVPVKDISKQMKIPIRTVYYYLKKAPKNNP
jgi:hypothetical protein